MFKKISELIYNFISTDQSHYVEQQNDGSYHKKFGLANADLINSVLSENGSIAIYQKNIDLTIKWICFDFDIKKKHLDTDLRNSAEIELEKTVRFFCAELDILNIPYLLEFSGNRGFHVWITFNENLGYRTGYDIQQSILNKTNLDYNDDLIALDLFPHSATPTGGVGLGVKIPLSLHKLSGYYSYLIKSSDDIDSVFKHNIITEKLLQSNIEILENHKSISKSYMEKVLGGFFEFYTSETIQYNRIKSIRVNNNPFSLSDLLGLWKKTKPLDILARCIEKKENLSNSERKLIVGILCNIECKNSPGLSNDIIHDIFKNFDNYDEVITTKGILSLRNFNFPSQQQIESIIGENFDNTLSIDELLRVAVPFYKDYKDANFEFSTSDIEITRIAELNYLFMNDEIQSKVLIEDLSSKDNSEFLLDLELYIDGKKDWDFYKHLRNEGDKQRQLISLKSSERVASSCIIKQISYYLDIKTNEYSHGYQINKGFVGGYIFKPWLYLWLKFISNITGAIENKNYSNYFIVKTDIKSFYDNIPHDNLKRLLLGDGESIVKNQVLLMGKDTKERYMKCLEALFKLTENIVGNNIGLPQGPAYARLLAEIYLAEVDREFINKLHNGEILLYQRYVDDIFFVTKTRSEADTVLSRLKECFTLLNLELNNEKTIISNISRFQSSFDKYRSQSKYSVDQVSKTFPTSSEKQKDMAINEFVSLVESDSCQDDLSFIFSHLDGVKELNDMKTKKIHPSLSSDLGRGSLFKNLFNFLFELNPGWEVIFEIENFNVLQSEALTSCIINAIEVNKDRRGDLIEIFEKVEPFLTYSDMVSEHIAYIILNFYCKVDIYKIDPKYYLSALKSVSQQKKLNVSSELLNHLNISINELKSLSEFVKIIYAFTYNDNVTKDDLSRIASLFNSKMLVEEKIDSFLSLKDDDSFLNSTTAYKFYYLLCLFSTSKEIKSTDLISSMWSFCARSFNRFKDEDVKFQFPNWLEKLKLIDINTATANWIISSIVDGNVFRGETDESRIFEKYHNSLLVYLSLNLITWEEETKLKLLELKEMSFFYNWLIDNEGVEFFPTNNKKWFERNLIENEVATLKKGSQILLRKPTKLFNPEFSFSYSGNEFSEIIVQHNNIDHSTFKKTIINNSYPEKIRQLLDFIRDFDSDVGYPSIFCPDKTYHSHNKSVFSPEFLSHKKIILYDGHENISSFNNTKDNFIKCFISYISDSDDVSSRMSQKYFNNIKPDIDLHKFIAKFYSNVSLFEKDNSEFSYDIAISTALYIYYSDLDLFKRMDSFMIQYSLFHNDDKDKHIFCIDKDSKFDSNTPCELLKTIKDSLTIISKLIKTSSFYLYDDIALYENIVLDLIDSSELGTNGVNLNQFTLSDITISSRSRKIKVDGTSYDFSQVKIINPMLKEITGFELRHTSLIYGSDYIYTYINLDLNDFVYLFSPNIFIGNMFSIISNRYEYFINKSKGEYSYPTDITEKINVKSLNGFDDAVNVIQNHQSITNADAESILINWLTRIPIKFHNALVNLIKAHEYMSENQLLAFISKIKELNGLNENLFLIKEVSDYNGTHRILYRDDCIGRDVASFSPNRLNSSSKSATLLVDLILSGSQILSALDYYFGIDSNVKEASYFSLSDTQREVLINKFKNFDFLNICTVLYTDSAIVKIQEKVRELLGTNIIVKVISGKDISSGAFFGTSLNLSENNKNEIRKLLLNNEDLSDLYDRLDSVGKLPFFNSQNLNDMNLVARYKSLPKKSFAFLRSGLKLDPNCKPFNIILEPPMNKRN